MKNSVIAFLFSILISPFAFSQPDVDSPLDIVFNSTAYVELNLIDVDTTFNLAWSYHPQLAKDRLKTPSYEISNDTSVVIPLTIHMPQKETVKILNLGFPVFLTPGDTISVTFSLTKKNISYEGKNKSINEYYHSVYQQKTDIWIELAGLFGDEELSLSQLHDQMDSLASAELDLLKKTKINLPKWFTILETKQIEFHNAHYKLATPQYRNFASKENQVIPAAENYGFTKDLDLKSPYNQYIREFYVFTNFYAFYQVYGKHYVVTDSTTLLFNDPTLATRMFEVLEGQLSDENMLAYMVHNTYRDINKNSVRKKARFQYIKDHYGEENAFYQHLVKEEAKMPDLRLKKGDKAPGFYLDDGSENYYSLEQQKGKVVLLNFYIRGCKPCFAAVPHEKALLKKYGEKGFNIVNICMTNSIENFNAAKEQFQMDGLNLYSQGNWLKSLSKKYGLAGYPHYALIDPAGNIIMNHAFKPGSDELEDLIVDNLPE